MYVYVYISVCIYLIVHSLASRCGYIQLMLMLSFSSPLPFPFLYYLPISSLSFLFFPVSLVPSLPFVYYSDSSPPVLLCLGLVPRDFFLSLNNSVLNFSLFSLRFFLCPSVRTHYYFPLSPDRTRYNLPWSSTGVENYPFLFFSIYYQLY